MSYKIEAISSITGEVVEHAFRFATQKEAVAYAASLFGPWTGCNVTVLPSVDPVNYPPPEDDEDDND